jgi:DNA-binding MltR family transcriptional regulator
MSEKNSETDAADYDWVYAGINELSESLDALDERGLILSLSAFAEEALGDLLLSFMLPVKQSEDIVKGFSAPLGTFSSRTKATYALGLITKNQFDDLNRLREIRNIYAHGWRTIKFEHPKVAKEIKALNYSNMSNRYPRDLISEVRSSISALLIELRTLAHLIKRDGKRAQVTRTHLIMGFPGDFEEKIASARTQLDTFVQNLQSANGDERIFYKNRLRYFLERLKVIPQPDELNQKRKYIAFCENAKIQIEAILAQ